MKRQSLIGGVMLGAASSALGQVCDVLDWSKYAWGENIGWLNFRDAGSPPGSAGLILLGDHLGGWVWGENVGWINLGSSTTSQDGPYSNASGTTHGVNLNPTTGELSGYAWGENIGWINFGGGAMATPAKPARLDAANRRLRGYAWGENVGWINLDDDESFITLLCYADVDGNGWVNGDDFDSFMLWFDQGHALADIDRNSWVNGDDFDSFTAAFDAGC